MKKMLFTAALLLAGAMTSTSADRRNFWLLNNTGRKINSVFIAAHGTDAPWGSDVLGNSAVPNGLGEVIYFLDNSSRCVYDFRIGYGDGTQEDYLQGRNLCQFHAIQFNSGTNDAF
jgi:hypothetical protein